MKTFHLGDNRLIEMADCAYYFSTNTFNFNETDFTFWNNTARSQSMQVGQYKVVPEGVNNNFPVDIRNLLERSNIAEGILNRQRGLQLGQGIALYYDDKTDGSKDRKYTDNPEIEKWLGDWDSGEYFINCLTDFLHRPQFFSKVYRNRGPRAGLPGFIKKLEHIPDFLCRREYPDTLDKLMQKQPDHIFISDWDSYTYEKPLVYPGFDFDEPFRHKVSVIWTHLYQYGRSARKEVVPSWWGAARWIDSGANVPDILKSLNKNMLNIKWHIITPQSYWNMQRDKLMADCIEQGRPYKDEMLQKMKDDILKGLSRVLSGIENVGKFFHSESVMEVLELGKAQLSEWKIVPIDQKVDDFIKSQILVGEKADSAATSGMGLHPSLSNIIINGKLASGSEMLYAYKLFLATETQLVEDMVFAPANYAMKLNGFDSSYKLGFYHGVVQREENIAPQDRVVSNNN